jgi:hypothetical protein
MKADLRPEYACDFPFTASSSKIIVVQSMATLDLTTEDFFSRDSEFFGAVSRSLAELRLIHVGSLHADLYDDPRERGRVVHHLPCGGILTVKSDLRKEGMKCDCGVDLKVVQQSTLISLADTLFFLALKQVFPFLPMLNYLDCQRAPVGYHIGDNGHEGIKQLGMVSVARRVLYGCVRDVYFRDTISPVNGYDLGFTVIPGMDTLNGCGQAEMWSRFLQVEYLARMGRLLNNLSPLMMGPLPARE